MVLFRKAQNFVTYIQKHDCARPWFVYAETAAPAFLKLLITLSFPLLDDVARNLGYQITSGGSGPGGRGAKRWGKSRASNINNAVNNISQGGLRHLLIVTEPLEKIGFAWLLWNGTDQFFYDWQTMLMKSQYCDMLALGGPLQRSMGDRDRWNIAPGGVICGQKQIDQNRSNWASTAVSASLPFAKYSCVFTVTFQAPLNGISNAFVQLRITGNVGSPLIQGEPQGGSQGTDVTCMVKADFWLPAGGSIVWELAGPAVPVGVIAVEGQMIVWQR